MIERWILIFYNVWRIFFIQVLNIHDIERDDEYWYSLMFEGYPSNVVEGLAKAHWHGKITSWMSNAWFEKDLCSLHQIVRALLELRLLFASTAELVGRRFAAALLPRLFRYNGTQAVAIFTNFSNVSVGCVDFHTRIPTWTCYKPVNSMQT